VPTLMALRIDADGLMGKVFKRRNCHCLFARWPMYVAVDLTGCRIDGSRSQLSTQRLGLSNDVNN
jgi:hypothetical protein